MADYAELKRKLGERRGYDGDDTRLGSWINDARAEIFGMRNDWSWARGEWQFRTRAPESGTISAGGWVLGSNKVSGLAAATVSRTGAWLTMPDGALSQIIAGAAAGTSVFLETEHPDATTVGDYKVYFLDYPLPSGMRGILSVTVTGNGRTYPIHQRSIHPVEMARRTHTDYETVPTSYSAIKPSRLPTPRAAASAVLASGGTLAAAVYKWWWCWRNTATGQLGPLSPALSETATLNQKATVTMSTKWDLGRRVFRSLAGGSAPYFLADVAATGTYEDLRTDDDLGFDNDTQHNHGRHTEAAGQHLVRLWPPPDDQYMVTVQFYRSFRVLVEDNDMPLIPVEWHGAILKIAESLALVEEEQHGAALSTRQQGMAMVEKMTEAEDIDQNDSGALGGGRLASSRPNMDELGYGEGRFPHLLDQ
jgi:hypothetical protein